MKNRWKHIFIPVLAMALCLSLAACGNSDNVAGNDWRTTGVVAGSGTITHDGESVDVLVTVSESSAAFYRDLPEQVLFDSVSFPMSIPDAEQAFNTIHEIRSSGINKFFLFIRFTSLCKLLFI